MAVQAPALASTGSGAWDDCVVGSAHVVPLLLCNVQVHQAAPLMETAGHVIYLGELPR